MSEGMEILLLFLEGLLWQNLWLVMMDIFLRHVRRFLGDLSGKKSALLLTHEIQLMKIFRIIILSTFWHIKISDQNKYKNKMQNNNPKIKRLINKNPYTFH